MAQCNENDYFIFEVDENLLLITKWLTSCEWNANCIGNKSSISGMGGFFIEVGGVRLSHPTTIKGAGGAFEIDLTQDT